MKLHRAAPGVYMTADRRYIAILRTYRGGDKGARIAKEIAKEVKDD